MSSIIATLEKTGTLFILKRKIEEILTSEPKALTLLIAASNKFTNDKFDSVLTNLKIPVSGGIFHKIIFRENLLDRGTIIIAWYNDITVTNYKNIENTNTIKDLVGIASGSNNESIGEHLIFIDGAVSNLEENLDALYKKNGFRASFSGGAAGLLSLESTPCIVTNGGLLKNTMQTISTHHKSRITVTHGWEKISGPHLVTSANKTLVKSLNYQPIIPFYVKHNNAHGSKTLEKATFDELVAEYPIGIENLDEELLVRCPIKHTEDSIQYVGNIPEYSKVYILGGSSKSTRGNVDKELNKLNLKEEDNIDASFIFSCVKRNDNDEHDQAKEVAMLAQHLSNSKNVIGALSLGEIATSKSRLLQLHSKTIVITQLEGGK